jgi:hypothetical protein
LKAIGSIRVADGHGSAVAGEDINQNKMAGNNFYFLPAKFIA